MDITFHEPDRRRRDPSNLLTMIEDAMEGAVYADDAQIVGLPESGADDTGPIEPTGRR